MIELKSFNLSDTKRSANILSQQHRLARKTIPMLPASYEDPETAEKLISQLFQKENSSGVIALENDRIVGYLIGTLIDSPQWGKWAWMYSGGHALAQHTDPMLYADMYAKAADTWVKQGYYTHMAEISSVSESVLKVWYLMGFGHQQDYALKDLQKENSFYPKPDIEIRQAKPGDEKLLQSMATIIAYHQADAPTWVFAPESYIEDITEGYGEMISDKDATVWLAFYQNQVAAFQAYFDIPANGVNLITPEKCNYLLVAGTKPEYRSKKLGLALTCHGFQQAYENGYRYCKTDWRTTNLLSSQFWPKQGFEVVMHRLSRTLDTQTLNLSP